jgi:glycolate oxidase FAD binding subunit
MVERAPSELKAICEAWGSINLENLAIMRRIKTEFDPAGCLSPGRFVGGL